MPHSEPAMCDRFVMTLAAPTLRFRSLKCRPLEAVLSKADFQFCSGDGGEFLDRVVAARASSKVHRKTATPQGVAVRTFVPEAGIAGATKRMTREGIRWGKLSRCSAVICNTALASFMLLPLACVERLHVRPDRSNPPFGAFGAVLRSFRDVGRRLSFCSLGRISPWPHLLHRGVAVLPRRVRYVPTLFIYLTR
jgi:hypothetical protein